MRHAIAWSVGLGFLLAAAGQALAEEPPIPPPLPPLAATDVQPPPLPPQLPAVQFFVSENGQPVGPLSLEQMQARIQGGQTKRSDLVWKGGTPDWVKAETITELKQLFAAAPPDMPVASKWEQFMLGVWEAAGTSPQGFDWALRVSYTADGRYSGYQVLTYAGTNTQAAIAGTWKITPAGENKFSLILDAPGQVGSTTVFTVVDENTLLNEQEGYYARRIAR
jgi:hypothetical protein